MAGLVADRVSVWFARPERDGAHPLQALAEVSLAVANGQLVALIGPSGCGKSTLLNAITGQVPYEGRILLDGQPVRGIPANVGYMFQQDALLPWRTVLANAAFGLEVRRVDRPARETRAAELLAAVGLAGFERFYPHELSGGMAKRVALAQTLAYDPSLLLMDEPFGALDAQTRQAVQGVFLDLWERRRPPTLFVTHDIGEAVALSDRVVVLGRRPGTVIGEHTVPLPRPRVLLDLRFDARFVEIERRVWMDLRSQVTGTADPADAAR